jgi:sporulation protein YlmC with PRC-barrel domain
MKDTTEFTIGVDASCTDGVCGEVSRVVIDPVAQAVTHLVVQPKHRRELDRLVPLDLVDTTTGEVRLRCTMAEFEKLDAAEETRFLPGSYGYGGYGQGQAYCQPYFGLGGMGMGMGGSMAGGMVFGGGLGMTNRGQAVTYDTVPLGEVAVRRGESVRATDGEIGRVQGLVIDPSSHHVTHVLLEEGHLWGKKEVAIPIRSVTGVEDGVQLNITKHDVEDLPSVDIDHPAR